METKGNKLFALIDTWIRSYDYRLPSLPKQKGSFHGNDQRKMRLILFLWLNLDTLLWFIEGGAYHKIVIPVLQYSL